MRRLKCEKGGHGAALLFALALLWTKTVPCAMAETVPWGAGCAPAPAGTVRTAGNCGAKLIDGRAIPPPGSPTLVKLVISAANQIRHRPYVWGGGHGSWSSRGYDCSGAVGYALHGAGLLDTTMVSGQLATWGEAGVGKWITVYANDEHVFMIVAGLRFDTRGDPPGVRGPRWHRGWVNPSGFVPRHPSAL